MQVLHSIILLSTLESAESISILHVEMNITNAVINIGCLLL